MLRGTLYYFRTNIAKLFPSAMFGILKRTVFNFSFAKKKWFGKGSHLFGIFQIPRRELKKNRILRISPTRKNRSHLEIAVIAYRNAAVR